MGKLRRHLSTAETLTLVTVGVVVAVLAIAMVGIRVTLNEAAIETAQDGLARGVKQLAFVSVLNIRQSRARYAAVAHDSAVVRALGARDPQLDSPSAKAVRDALAKLQAPADSGMPIEVWNTSGRRVAFVGNDVSEEIGLRSDAETAGLTLPMRKGLDLITTRDSLQLGKMYRIGDRTLFWVVMPVVVEGTVRGFITQQRRIATNTQTEQTIRELGGNSVAGYYHNVDGSSWTTLGGTPAVPLQVLSSGERFRPGAGEVLYSEATVAGTPLVLAMEAPRNVVVARSMATVRRLIALSAFLTILGALIAWTIGHRVSRPLIRLTQAAESVARGDYTARVSTIGSDEVVLLAHTFNRMAERIAETSAGLEEARAAAETGSRAKSEFLAAMSHELRTPLNAIGGYTELMEMELRGPISDEQRRDLARIRASQQHLLGLIGSVLDLSRIESGRVSYDLASIVVEPFLASLDALVLPQATAKHQVLALQPSDPTLTVLADREKLRQIMLNLLSNAIRHSPTGASITVAAAEGTPGTIDITVRDTGPGIPADRREAIFEPFVQLDQSFRSRDEGIGLGLAISRDLARAMGGDLTVASVMGEGASFILTLPAGNFDERSQMVGTMETPAQGVREVA